MRMNSHSEQISDLSSLVGIVAGFGLLLPAFLVPELRMLAIPGFAVLLPSLLYCTR
jgi:hypothetical protein